MIQTRVFQDFTEFGGGQGPISGQEMYQELRIRIALESCEVNRFDVLNCQRALVRG